MEIGFQQNLTLTQQLVMTPQLQQAIKLLQLSRVELAEMIQQEMEQNPALEEQAPDETVDRALADPGADAPESDRDTPVKEITIDEKVQPDTDWENYINEYNSTGRGYTETEHTEAPNFEAFTSEKTTLEAH
ncbi:MAG: RNA polymerase sigma-54 factor, partial [Desulfotignum sp.]|nr:RNA polymerase sigma-54 factor [Desulfotignum sp.]